MTGTAPTEERLHEVRQDLQRLVTEQLSGGANDTSDPPNGPWDADTLTEGKIWTLTQAAVLLYYDCEWASVAGTALEFAAAHKAEKAGELADEVFWAHLPSEWLRSWEKLQAWFDDEGWPVPYPRPATLVQG